MAEILVTAATLKAKAAELQSLNDSFKTRVGDLTTQEASLSGMWEGQANTAFHAAFMQDKTQMDGFNTLMNQYIQALLAIAAEYEKAESINVNTATTRTV